MKKEILGFVALVSIGLSLALGLSQKAPSDSGKWRIGLLLCLSGPCAADGIDAMRGAEIAAELINAQGGVLGCKIEFEVQDTNEAVSGAKAVSGFHQLRLNKDLNYFIGPSWTPAGLALAPIVAGDREILMASPSLGAPEFHTAGDNIFNVRGTDEIASRSEARYAYALGLRRIAIFSSQQPWEAQQALTFEDEFTKLGGEIVIKEEPLPTVTDVKSEIHRIVRSRPDGVFLASLVLMSRAAKELRDLKFQGPRIASNIDGTRITQSAGALEGAVFFSFQKPTSEFQRRFRARYKEDSQPAGAIAYDVVFAFAKAVERAGTFDVQVTKPAILSLDFEGASGRIRFDPNGCAIRKAHGWKVAGSSYGALKAKSTVQG